MFGPRIKMQNQFEPRFADRQHTRAQAILRTERIRAPGHTLRDRNALESTAGLHRLPMTAPFKLRRHGHLRRIEQRRGKMQQAERRMGDFPLRGPRHP